jgi:predicted acyl esterase
MPQLQLPIFPAGAKCITDEITVERRDKQTVATPYYLHAGGVLSPEKPVAAPPVTFLFDPKNPVPTLGGNISSQGTLMFQGADRSTVPC